MASNIQQSDSEMVEQFINITGSDATVAKNMLEAFGNNLEMAINMFLEGNTGTGDGHEDVTEVPVNYASSDGSSGASNKSYSSSTSSKERGKHAK